MDIQGTIIRSSRRGRTGCLTCRRRHLKCDEEKPDCGRCRRTHRECIPDDQITFRNSQKVAARGKISSLSPQIKKIRVHRDSNEVFGADQTWVETPPVLSFIDETAHVDAEYRHQQLRNRSEAASDPPTPEDLAVAQPGHPTDSPAPAVIEEETEELVRQDLEPVATPTYLPELSFLIPTGPSVSKLHDGTSHLVHAADDADFVALGLVTSNPSYSIPLISPVASISSLVAGGVRKPSIHSLSPEQPRLQLYGPRMRLPFQDAQEAMIFQHFLESLAGQLDITDMQRHFAVDVPERALFCPVLLEALLAFSARHLSRTSNFDSAIADHHHQACVRLMIPMLDQKELVADETLFAATVILRAFEETSESRMGCEPERHLTGTSVFANAQLEFQTWGGLGHNAFWIYVRQCIYMSLLTQTQLKVDLEGWEERLSFDLGFDETNDCTWAQRMIWIVAEVVSCCFGNNVVDWEDLKAKIDKWDSRRPKSFDPILYRPRDFEAGRYYPEIRLGHPWHVTGMQYYYIARLFLAIYNPNTPKVGLGYQRLRRNMDEEVLKNAEAVIGISLATPLAAARITACTAIVACGPWFHDRPREQQELLLQLLKKAELENALPTASLAQGLKDEWNWKTT
ncbi:hypothetical protein LTR99_000902 [Exophiala xenobiotica]|uniref:Zn(2)-C6 fungal-type domain-containing protein n=1 Tax=Vermiconidia calcicola TaxID=1690605 RepID=A0AAV9QMV3_9PEZI|nr:hypothetical protein LTR47_009348 [Exophiala xenobiotica]KAK5540754.1 hypothetical protein LTR23_005985 [Chaetothyriales sp. CCFEE 6169]KAK5545465.1 hypothetical protein LTR25_000472 [Vermiconidia calcicola]KAK5245376.1 hypothetical protein LTS06_009196 [Exophiala xenobiotica]KAK5307930.1 hypothetical protein LTR99_000902 [Exophiala xenobiotica]